MCACPRAYSDVLEPVVDTGDAIAVLARLPFTVVHTERNSGAAEGNTIVHAILGSVRRG